jgi:hypothetical protein
MNGLVRGRSLGLVISSGLLASMLLAGGGVVGAASAPSAASPQSVLSHFLCWAGIFPIFDGPVVELTNRFGTFDAKVDSSDLMCNPVKKTRGGKTTPIVDERQHLKEYDVQTDPIGGSADILVTNQFGKDQRIIITRQPSGLLVPTRKFPHKAPTGLDHFACYQVLNNFGVDKGVKLKDEFLGFKTTVIEQLFHCIPTKKVHGTRVFAIKHRKANLACYNIEPKTLGQPKQRRTKNQFEDVQITATQAQFLCVPSKIRPTP